jgi:hypothetical protein
MDGLDLHDMLDKALSFADVIGKKARHAAESGNHLPEFATCFHKRKSRSLITNDGLFF